MAIVKLNDLINTVSGTIGNLELLRRGKNTVVREKPRAAPASTPARLVNRQKFREAAAYGRTVQLNPTLRAVYASAARERGVAPYHVALKDFLNPPEVAARLDRQRHLTPLGQSQLQAAAAAIGQNGVLGVDSIQHRGDVKAAVKSANQLAIPFLSKERFY